MGRQVESNPNMQAHKTFLTAATNRFSNTEDNKSIKTESYKIHQNNYKSQSLQLPSI